MAECPLTQSLPIVVEGTSGVLFTVAGQNALDSFYPNFSIFWYWSEPGK